MYAASLATSPKPGPRHGRKLVLAFVGVVTILGLGVEGARAEEVTPVKRVSYADLDLRTQAGRDTLVRRVRFASKHVCAIATSWSPMWVAQNRKCVKDAFSDAMAQVDRAIVLAELSR